MSLIIHDQIKLKLNTFYEMNKIPNIIFHGPCGCGKKTIVNDFINMIYKGDKNKINTLTTFANCAHGKGIKFIRDELKFFAKTNINLVGGEAFKSIILLNADKLTMDAQSALRRCIELSSHTTRFFIIVEDKYKLLKPILSRFCEIYIPEPMINGKIINLYTYNINNTFNQQQTHEDRLNWLKKTLIQKQIQYTNMQKNISDLIKFSNSLYEKGYSGIDILQLLKQPLFLNKIITQEKRYELLVAFNKAKKEFRNEKILILFILNFIFLSLDFSLENISFM